MVNERPYRHPPSQLRHSAVVIPMKMGHQQKVDLFQAGFTHRGEDAQRIPVLKAGESRVNQQRLARRRDDKRGLPTLDIDEIDVERVRRGENGERRLDGECHDSRDDASPQDVLHRFTIDSAGLGTACS